MTLWVDIEKRLGNFQLKVQLAADNEVMGLLGASGCGKSVTLKAIAGILTPDKGQIVVNGQVLFDSARHIDLSPQKRQVGYLFQNYALFPNMTVEQNIAAGIRLPKAERSHKTAENIRRFYLQGLEKHYPRQLSGGQQQRVALARIVASEPLLLMLDEPFSALDSYLKWQLEQEVSQVLEDFGGTTLLVSHDRDEVFRLCQRIAIMHEGHVDVCADKWTLFEQPQTLAASLLTGCKNHSLARRLDEHTLQAVEWNVLLHSQAPVPEALSHVGLRAHFLERVTAPGDNVFPAQIDKMIEDTFSAILLVRLQGQNGWSAPIRWEVDKALGQELAHSTAPLYVHLPADKLLLLTSAPDF